MCVCVGVCVWECVCVCVSDAFVDDAFTLCPIDGSVGIIMWDKGQGWAANAEGRRRERKIKKNNVTVLN